jgi:hypothetical protein
MLEVVFEAPTCGTYRYGNTYISNMQVQNWGNAMLSNFSIGVLLNIFLKITI